MACDVTTWNRLAARLRRALGYMPPTLEEADKEMAEAEEVPMSEEEIQTIVDGVIDGTPPREA